MFREICGMVATIMSVHGSCGMVATIMSVHGSCGMVATIMSVQGNMWNGSYNNECSGKYVEW